MLRGAASRDQLVVYVVPAATGTLVLAVVREAKDRLQNRAAKAIVAE